MIDYKNGKIYKLVSNYFDKCYIGSTCQLLSSRLYQHKESYKRYLCEKFKFMTSFILFEFDNVQIVLIENYPCKNKEELHARERYWIENLECVNKVIPTRNKKEHYQDNKEEISQKQKDYYEENKEKILQKNKDYYEENKEKILQKNKDYYEENKEELAQKNKKYRKENKEELAQHQKEYQQANKEKISNKRKETIVCDCGLTINKRHLARHTRSKKHTDALGLPPVEKDEKNKLAQKIKRKTYQETNKEKINEKKREKIQCDCGLTVNRNHLARHKRTEAHKFIVSES